MSEAIEAVAAPRVTEDASCRRCGYNLRGLEVAGNCPECGGAVVHSIQGDLLQYAGVGWLERLRLGLSIMLWGLVVQLVAGVVGFALLRLFLVRNLALTQGWGIASGLVWFAGVWLVTEPDPAERFAPPGRSVRVQRVARVAMVVALGLSVARIGLLVAVAGSVAETVETVVSFLHEVSSLVGMLAVLTWFEQLARRMPLAPLAKRARQLRKAYGIATAIEIGSLFFLRLFLLIPMPGTRAVWLMMEWLLLLAVLGMLIVLLMLVRFLQRMRRGLLGSLQEARGARTGGVRGSTQRKIFSKAPHP